MKQVESLQGTLERNASGIGARPEGFDSYFSTRFPKLLIEVYQIFLTHCADEEVFQKFLRSTIKTCIARFVTECVKILILY